MKKCFCIYLTYFIITYLSFISNAFSDPWLDQVILFDQPTGSSTQGGIAEDALGASDAKENYGYVSIDTPETLILAFTDNSAINGTGDDLFIDEWWNGDSDVRIYASKNNIDYVYLGTTNGDEYYDLTNYGLSYVNYIKFIGVDNGGQYAGFDLDAVMALNSSDHIDISDENTFDINGDGKTGLEEAIYALQVVAGITISNNDIPKAKDIQINNGIVGEKLTSLADSNYYRFILSEENTIAIISTGNLDLRGQLYELRENKLIDIDADQNGIADSGDRRISNEFTDKTDLKHDNFMIRPGNMEEIRLLPKGTYYLSVSFDDDANADLNNTYGVILLCRSTSKEKLIENFFYGMNSLINQDDNYTDNDYLDIYVQALFPDIYDTNWGNSVTYGGVVRERQCKALSNFYVNYIFGQGEYLYDDCTIDAHFSDNNPDWVLRGSAITIYNKKSDPVYGNINDIQRGDVWVKDMGLVCDDGAYELGFNHYGLYFDNTQIIDSNWSSPTDGKLRFSSNRQPDKIIRPITE